MAKRGATMQLTDRNWDQEEESEEAGHFKVAGNEELSKRVIKKAKRRVPGSGESISSFKGFQGFGIPQNASTPMNNNSMSTSISGFKGFENFNEKKEIIKEETKISVEKTPGLDSAYMAQLKRLNEEVCEHIKKHIKENPYVDLSPVFKDYEKHLCNLEKKFPALNQPADSNEDVSTKTTILSHDNVKTVHSSSISIGIPMQNGNTDQNSKSSDVVTDNEPDDIPKTHSQVKSMPEENAFYSTRCKLFFKRDNDWSELGIGMLNLKKISDEKIQVLVRNDTALGKILLNVFLTKETPTSRSGKNNVLIMSVPNPPVFVKDGDNTKPVSYLIRVKTAENADELYKNLQPAKEEM